MRDFVRKRVLAALLIGAGQAHAMACENGLPNLSDRPLEQCKTVDFFVNALLWRASETVDWAFTLSTSGDLTESVYKTIAFDWDPGFRVGLGYNMLHDEWDTQMAYTWYQAEAKDQAGGAVTSGFLAARLSLLEPFHRGKVSFQIHYNMFDWDLGRSFSVSRYLTLRPFIGAKAGWIDQAIRAKWATPDFGGLGFVFSASESVKNNFRGGGPKGGLNGKWILGKAGSHSFSLIGNFSGAYLWGNWTLQDEFIDVFHTRISIPMANRNFGALLLQALMGLGWEFDFDKNRSHFALRAGYEIEDWLNHFQVFTDISGAQNTDLFLQGMSLDLRLDF